MPDKPARPLIKGKVGDQFIVAKRYEGNFNNAVGVPLDAPRGRAMLIPPGEGTPDLTVVARPDFRRAGHDKNDAVFPKKYLSCAVVVVVAHPNRIIRSQYYVVARRGFLSYSFFAIKILFTCVLH